MSCIIYRITATLAAVTSSELHIIAVQCDCVCVHSDVVDRYYRSFNHYRAIEAVMSVLREANAFVQTHEPWLLAKSSDSHSRMQLDCILHVGLESARVAALALCPVTPGLSRRIMERLGCVPTECSRQHMTQPVVDGRKLGADCGPLFSRIKPSQISNSVSA